jgi:uncharacterized damage-inducible protein DinB
MEGKRMPDLSATVASGFANYYAKIRSHVHTLVEPLSPEQLWQRPYTYGNSVGHLLLHLTGNLNYYIGTQIAGTGYIRDRNREFTEPDKDHKPKENVLADFDRAISMVIATIKQQSAADWTTSYSADLETAVNDRFDMVLRSAAHAYHHVGQMIYLCRELSKA